MGSPLRISTAGVHGVVKAQHALEFAAAFHVLLERPDAVLVARDARASSVMLREGVVAALLASGRDVVDLGMVPTPVLQHAIQRLGAAGGISIGALTFLGPNGAYLSSGEASELLDLYHLRKFDFKDWTQMGCQHANDEAIDCYVDVLEQVFDIHALAGVRIAADCSGGLSGLILKRLRDRYPLDLTFGPSSSADLAVRFGVDSDRIALGCDEMVLPLLAEYQLQRHPGRMVITNLSTSMMVDDVAARYGATVLRVPVGRQHAMDALSMYPAERIAVAGEGTGAVMLPEFRFVYDGVASMLALATHLKQQRFELPSYDMRKAAVPLETRRVPALMAALEQEWRSARLDMRDGLRADFEEGWFHVRVSNTEPVVRVIAEVRKGSAEGLVAQLTDMVRRYA